MLPNPLISVVIPTYNRADKLQRALQSLVNQTYKDFEVIVCDNGSIDATSDVCSTYSHILSLQYIKLSNNSGSPAKPRNEGIKVARGQWISFLDSDDWYESNRMQIIANQDLKKFDVFYHPLITVKGGQRGYTIKLRQLNHDNPHLDLLYNLNTVVTSSAVVRKDLFNQKLLFDENIGLRGVEDFDLWIKLAIRGAKFKLIRKSLGYYEYGDDNFTQKGDEQISRLTQVYQPYFTQKIIAHLNTRKVNAAYSYLIARVYFANRDYASALKGFKKSILDGSIIIKVKAAYYGFHSFCKAYK